MVGAEERRVSARLGRPGDRKLVVVGGALLRFDEDAEIHALSLWAAQKKSTLSVLTNIPVRADVAMTGEITLRGEVLPIGGLKEKLLAARRGGIKTVIIPKENERDLKEVPDNIKEHLTIRAVKWIDEVLAIALESMPEPLSDEDYRAGSITAGSDAEQDEKNRINTH